MCVITVVWFCQKWVVSNFLVVTLWGWCPPTVACLMILSWLLHLFCVCTVRPTYFYSAMSQLYLVNSVQLLTTSLLQEYVRALFILLKHSLIFFKVVSAECCSTSLQAFTARGNNIWLQGSYWIDMHSTRTQLYSSMFLQWRKKYCAICSASKYSVYSAECEAFSDHLTARLALITFDKCNGTSCMEYGPTHKWRAILGPHRFNRFIHTYQITNLILNALLNFWPI